MLSTPDNKVAEQRAATAQSDATALSEVARFEEERRRMIAEAAYYLAERRGFAPGHEEDDWLQAEAQIDDELTALAR